MTPPSHRPHYLTEQERFLRWLRNATLFDNTAAEVCLHDNIPCAQLILRIILKREDLLVASVTAQKSIPSLYGHGVRLDILAEDREGRLYDIEVQVGGTLTELTLRARMYSSMLDLHQLKSGEDYKRLREHWVIFLVDRDIFGLGLPLYRVERWVMGEDEGKDGILRLFGDGAHILFVNGAMRDGDTPLAWLMSDMQCPDPARMHYPELAQALGKHKITDEGVRKMREAYTKLEQEIAAALEQEIGEEYLAQGIAIGEKRGMEESKRLFALRLLKDGFALEQIANYTSLPLEDVRTLAEQATKTP